MKKYQRLTNEEGRFILAHGFRSSVHGDLARFPLGQRVVIYLKLGNAWQRRPVHFMWPEQTERAWVSEPFQG